MLFLVNRNISPFPDFSFNSLFVETVEIHLPHFIPLCADFSWTAGRLFLNVDPKPSPWRQLHHHLIAAGHSKKDESGLLFWGLRIIFASSKGLASYCKADTTFTFHFSILTLSNASLGINNREIKSESGISFAIASQPLRFLKVN